MVLRNRDASAGAAMEMLLRFRHHPEYVAGSGEESRLYQEPPRWRTFLCQHQGETTTHHVGLPWTYFLVRFSSFDPTPSEHFFRFLKLQVMFRPGPLSDFMEPFFAFPLPNGYLSICIGEGMMVGFYPTPEELCRRARQEFYTTSFTTEELTIWSRVFLVGGIPVYTFRQWARRSRQARPQMPRYDFDSLPRFGLSDLLGRGLVEATTLNGNYRNGDDRSGDPPL